MRKGKIFFFPGWKILLAYEDSSSKLLKKKKKQVLMLTLKNKMHLLLKGSGVFLNPSTKATRKTTVMTPQV